MGSTSIWGFVAAFYVHGTLSIFGISVILVQSAQAFFVFKLLGAAYLIWLGVKALVSAFKRGHSVALEPCKKNSRPVSLSRAFSEGFLTNVLNPKVSMFYLAAFPQFIAVNDSAISAYALITAHAAVNIAWLSMMIVMLSNIKKATNNDRLKRWLNAVTGLIFIGFGSKLAFMRSS
jgi:threonine/homoserine/homoserine lactone efflux protein